MTPHSFRHYFISKALAAGVPLGDVADMARSSPSEIWKTYRHFIAEAEQRSHTMHQQMWAAAGLDEKGNPQTR
jgi:hypothetical protein